MACKNEESPAYKKKKSLHHTSTLICSICTGDVVSSLYLDDMGCFIGTFFGKIHFCLLSITNFMSRINKLNDSKAQNLDHKLNSNSLDSTDTDGNFAQVKCMESNISGKGCIKVGENNQKVDQTPESKGIKISKHYLVSKCVQPIFLNESSLSRKKSWLNRPLCIKSRQLGGNNTQIERKNSRNNVDTRYDLLMTTDFVKTDLKSRDSLAISLSRNKFRNRFEQSNNPCKEQNLSKKKLLSILSPPLSNSLKNREIRENDMKTINLRSCPGNPIKAFYISHEVGKLCIFVGNSHRLCFDLEKLKFEEDYDYQTNVVFSISSCAKYVSASKSKILVINNSKFWIIDIVKNDLQVSTYQIDYGQFIVLDFNGSHIVCYEAETPKNRFLKVINITHENRKASCVFSLFLEKSTRFVSHAKFWEPDHLVIVKNLRKICVYNYTKRLFLYNLKDTGSDVTALGLHGDKIFFITKTSILNIFDFKNKVYIHKMFCESTFVLGWPYIIEASDDKIVYSADQGVYLIQLRNKDDQIVEETLVK